MKHRYLYIMAMMMTAATGAWAQDPDPIKLNYDATTGGWTYSQPAYNVELKVTYKTDLTLTVNINGWTFGTTASTPTVSGNESGGAVTYQYKKKDAADENYSADVPTTVGNYTIRATVAETDDYADGTATTDFAITAADIPATAISLPTAKTLNFNGKAQELIEAGSVAGDIGTMQYSLDGTTWSNDIPKAINEGTHTVYYKVVGDENHNDVDAATIDVTIAAPLPIELTSTDGKEWTLASTPSYDVELVVEYKTDLTIAVNLDGWTFGDTPNAPAVSGNESGGAVTYQYKKKDAADETYSDDVPTDAGEYTVRATVAETDDYADGMATAEFTIGKAAGSIVYETATVIKTLGDEAFTYAATLEGDGTPAYRSGNEDVATVDMNTGLVTITGAGEALITATGVDGNNYTYKDLSASYTLTVTDKRTLRADIATATDFLNSIKDNSYYSAISSELSDAIAAAQQVSDDPAVLQTAIDQAADVLTAACQKAQDDKVIRDQLIVECTSPELTAAPGEKIDLKVNISSGVAPFTVSWTDTQGQPVGTVETSAMNEDIVVSALAEYSGEYTVTVVDAQQKSFSANATLTVTGEPLPAVFDDLSLEDESYWNGSDGKRSFISGGYRFDTEYKEEENGIYAYGFAYSNRTSSDFLTYAADRYNSCVGGGAEDTPNFGVFKMDRSHPMGAEVLGEEDRLVSGFYITNAASTYEAMQNGTDLARQFGIGDWLKVTVTGYDAAGTETGTVDFYLADFRDANAAYIIETWRWVDLTTLGKVKRLVFTMSGSDVNPWGSLNTPEYFCVDKLGGEKPEYEEPLLTSICLTRTYRTAEPVAIYSLSGVQQYELRPGVNIVKYSDGTTKKILVK